jgi:hypothetical protein
MQQSDLRGQLQTIKNNFALAQMGIALMALPDAKERFVQAIEPLRDHSEAPSFDYITYVFESDDLLKHATTEFRNSVLRNCLKEAYELVKLYGDATGQSGIIKAAPWYQFLRIVRNCLSHDLQLHFTQHDLKQLPVTWSGLTLDRSMHDKPLQARTFLSRQKALELISEVIAYVEQNVA